VIITYYKLMLVNLQNVRSLKEEKVTPIISCNKNMLLHVCNTIATGVRLQSVGLIKVYNILVGKPEVKRPLGRPRHRWEGDIKYILGK
jgi:hypothetical protein